jgi:hypothetical protein
MADSENRFDFYVAKMLNFAVVLMLISQAWASKGEDNDGGWYVSETIRILCATF